MTNRKYHWAIQVVPSMHPHAWRAHAGGYYAQACGRSKKSAVGYPAERFVAKSQRNPGWYCKDCAKAARLALAKESAPKPADGRGYDDGIGVLHCDGSGVLTARRSK